MKLSTIVGILTLAVVIAGIAAALWQLESRREQAPAAALERDLFGAPVPRSDPAQQPRTANAPETAPLPEEMHHGPQGDGAPVDMPDPLAEPEPPAEPFEPPQITAFA